MKLMCLTAPVPSEH